MNPIAHKMRKDLIRSTVSIDRLFTAAFGKSRRVYQRESLMGWRPLEDVSKPDFLEMVPRARRKAGRPDTGTPDVKIREASESILIDVTLPEINEESLYLEVADDLLIIRAEKAMPDHTKPDPENKQPRPMVHRYIKLPIAAKPGNVQAQLDGNVVRVEIRKPQAKI